MRPGCSLGNHLGLDRAPVGQRPKSSALWTTTRRARLASPLLHSDPLSRCEGFRRDRIRAQTMDPARRRHRTERSTAVPAASRSTAEVHAGPSRRGQTALPSWDREANGRGVNDRAESPCGWKRRRGAGARARGRIRGPRQPRRRLFLVASGICSSQRLGPTVCSGNHRASGVEQSAFLRDPDHPGHARQPAALSGRHRQGIGVRRADPGPAGV
jgi:hypothetical protein